ncbi:MAG TPA: NIPSNAP family protein [Pedobacter sp.]|nr:NIPSNAP family protein [Pedobacter sp.]
MKRVTLLFLTLLLSVNYLNATETAASRSFYQIRIYHLKNEVQEKTVDDYLKQAYLPALHRAGIEQVGVFKPIIAADAEQPAERLIYVLIPFSSYKSFSSLDKSLEKDQKYLSDGQGYLNALLASPPYDRMETILLNAFEAGPNLTLPKLTAPKKDRVYEFRSYEAPTEKLYRNKVQMFNKGDEIGLFKRLNFNAVFYGEVIAGSRMPNLIYLTTFENKADRDEHWKAFSSDAYWKKLSVMPEYQGNVSKNDTRLLYPADYSDI